MRTLRTAVPALLAVVLSVPALPAAAAAPARTTIEVVADGLDTPRGLIYDARRHRVLVAEAGEGGPARPHGGTCAVTEGGAQWCYGATGAVLQYTERSGSARRIVDRLPSIGIYDETGDVRFSVIGLHDLTLDRRQRLQGVFGLTGDTRFRSDLGRGATGLAQVMRLDGTPRPSADLAEFERRHDPDPSAADTNPYALSASPHGTMVADASGNDLLYAKPDGSVSLVAVFPARAPAGHPEERIESVPAVVTQGPDGAWYVGELTGFPYYKGEARVWRVVPGRAPTVFARGFTTITDLTFDGRGRLVVLEMAKEGLASPTDSVTGRLVRVERDGSRTDLATTGLANPGGVAYAGGGVYYVTNRSNSSGDVGQLLRITVRG